MTKMMTSAQITEMLERQRQHNAYNDAQTALEQAVAGLPDLRHVPEEYRGTYRRLGAALGGAIECAKIMRGERSIPRKDQVIDQALRDADPFPLPEPRRASKIPSFVGFLLVAAAVVIGGYALGYVSSALAVTAVGWL